MVSGNVFVKEFFSTKRTNIFDRQLFIPPDRGLNPHILGVRRYIKVFSFKYCCFAFNFLNVEKVKAKSEKIYT